MQLNLISVNGFYVMEPSIMKTNKHLDIIFYKDFSTYNFVKKKFNFSFYNSNNNSFESNHVKVVYVP